MTADTKIFVGGDAAISTAFEPDNMIQQRDNSVNRLIIECRTSKESLAELYEMFKKSVFAVAFGITADYHLAEDCVPKLLSDLPRYAISPKRKVTAKVLS